MTTTETLTVSYTEATQAIVALMEASVKADKMYDLAKETDYLVIKRKLRESALNLSRKTLEATE